MNLNKPAFWDLKKMSLWSILLLPLTVLYCLALHIREVITSKKKFEIKVVCIGNIYIGGTGKTPLAIKIASLLQNKFQLAIIKKDYQDHQDEISLLKKNCKVITGKSRKKAIQQAIRERCDLVILDDGFQDIEIKKDFSILCFSSTQGIGNGFVLPSGPLREPLKKMLCANIVCINGDSNLELEKVIKSYNKNLEIFYSKYRILNLDNYNNKNYFAFSGVGNNINFVNLLKKNKINVEDYKFFPDHYSYSNLDISKLKKTALENHLTLLTTEKDFLRLGEEERKNIEYLSTELIIDNEKKLIEKITSYENS
jgi:tetraacyldisaccharide 4'-kinase